ncbi:MAG: 50S ribosomal protein L29 [Planctomycetota bacterium]|jgi:large subunit ribosomal protein L29
MKVQEYRQMSLDELGDKLEEARRHLFDLRSQGVTEKLENSQAMRNTRRDIARIMTVIHQRQLEENKE